MLLNDLIINFILIYISSTFNVMLTFWYLHNVEDTNTPYFYICEYYEAFTSPYVGRECGFLRYFSFINKDSLLMISRCWSLHTAVIFLKTENLNICMENL